jgi:anaerobic magnesium-protoporphyrin IX monomethyl ester cyclase
MITPSFEDAHRAPGVMLDSHYPLGLAYLEAYLRQKGHEINVLFLNDYFYVNCALIVANHMSATKPDYVFIQMLTPNRVMGYMLIEFIHVTYPNTRIVLGGIHASVMADQLIRKFPYVMIVKGEGEIASNKILNGMWNPGTVVEGETIENLDELPFPNHALFWNQRRTTACLLTSRGCNFRCSFCVLDSISRRRVRFRSVKNVVDEIESLCATFTSLRRIWIHDDNFLLDNKRAIEICREIRRRNIRLIFICSGRIKPLSRELVQELEMTGFANILFGLESGSQEILKRCHKGITPEDAINAIELLKDSEMSATFFLIAGLPGEDDSTIDETIDLVQRMQAIKPIYYEDIGMLIVYPGTEVYKIAKEKGIIDDDYWLTDRPTPFYTAEHSLEHMYRLKDKLLAGIR